MMKDQNTEIRQIKEQMGDLQQRLRQNIWQKLFNKTSAIWGSLIVALLFGGIITATLTLPHIFTAGEPISSSQVNANFTALLEQINSNSQAFADRSGWRTVEKKDVVAASEVEFIGLQPGVRYQLDYNIQWNGEEGFMQGTFNNDQAGHYSWLRTSGHEDRTVDSDGEPVGTYFAFFSGKDAKVAVGAYITGSLEFQTATGNDKVVMLKGLMHSHNHFTGNLGAQYIGVLKLDSLQVKASAGTFTGRFVLTKYVI